MSSDTTWLHDLMLEVERREESGLNVIPEFLNDLMPHRRSEVLIEDAAFGVHAGIRRQYPPSARGRLRGQNCLHTCATLTPRAAGSPALPHGRAGFDNCSRRRSVPGEVQHEADYRPYGA